MATDSPLERDYPVRTGCAAMGCAVLFLAAVGGGAAAALPVGWEKFRNGQGWEMALGGLIVVVCVIASPLLLLAPFMLVVAIRDGLRPQLLRVTPTALILPPRLRGNPPKDEKGNVLSDAPLPQPEEVPFAAIRWVRREDGVGGSQLLVVHDRSPVTLVIQQFLMQAADFEELTTILRAAVPAAFATEPPPGPPGDPEPR